MPHSSGGGSHGGGSHGGHSHHSSSRHGGSRNSSRISRTNFAGARRYRYYHHGQERYFYSDREPDKIFNWKRLLIGLFYIPFIVPALFMMGGDIAKSTAKYDMSIVIKDEANVFEQTESLNDALTGFYEKTKISPAVITVPFEEWIDDSSLENYAFGRYLNEFDTSGEEFGGDDENHWLIVYTQKGQRGDDDFDWAFEGMQGDDTDSILTNSVTSDFNADLYYKLETLQEKPEQAIAEEFTQITQKIKKPSFFSKHIMFFSALFILAFVAFHAYFMMGLYEWKYRKAEPAPEDGENNYFDPNTWKD
ncbi:MAG TPA: hypothetical protein DCO72_00560 [Ruminococcus sp.]|nr:hypothetical protein [Ruminococcus sp.]